MDSDRMFMGRALEIAARQSGRTGENPAVGCVVVKSGQIIAQGVTADGGRPHAETKALKAAGDAAEGAAVYVTLEPCAHFGQTPPCVKALIKAKIARCVIACIDPDPRVHWQGAAQLQEHGIDTVIGVCEDEAKAHHAEFFNQF